jgi:hypothetical protein
MKHYYFFILGIIFLNLQSQNSTGFADPTDLDAILNYQIPDYRYSNFKLTGNASFNSKKEERITYSNSELKEIQSENNSIHLNPQYNILNESETNRNYFNIEFDLSQSYSSDPVYAGNTPISTYQRRNKSARISTVFNTMTYTKDLNYILNSNILLSYSEYKFKNESYNSFNIQRDNSANVQLGFGQGRKRNVSHVIRAKRFSERIIALNKVALSNSEILELASLLTKKSAFQSRYDRDSKYFWQEVENTIPRLFDDMPAYDIFYLIDAMSEVLGNREEGTEYELLFGLNHSKQNHSNYNSVELNLYGLYFNLDHSKNLSLDQQLNFLMNISYLTEKVRSVKEKTVFFKGGLNLEHLYVLADNLLNTTGANVNYTSISFEDKGLEGGNQIDFNLYTNLTLFLEDKYSLNLNLEYKSMSTEFSKKLTNSGFNGSLYLTYYFDRSFR